MGFSKHKCKFSSGSTNWLHKHRMENVWLDWSGGCIGSQAELCSEILFLQKKNNHPGKVKEKCCL